MHREIVDPEDLASASPQGFGTAERRPDEFLAAAGPGEARAVDDYLSRLVKYLPTEVVTAFLVLDAAFRAQDAAGGWLHWLVFGVLFLVTPFYLHQFMKVRKRRQIAVSSLAFVVWVVALPGPFGELAGYEPLHGFIALVLFTVIAPLLRGGRPPGTT